MIIHDDPPPPHQPRDPADREHVARWYREHLAAGRITVRTTPWHRDALAAELLAWTPPCRT